VLVTGLWQLPESTWGSCGLGFRVQVPGRVPVVDGEDNLCKGAFSNLVEDPDTTLAGQDGLQAAKLGRVRHCRRQQDLRGLGFGV
jgi:hypothetical protein